MTSLTQIESALVKRLFWRIRSAESDEQFQMPFGKFLAPLILKLNSSDEAVRSKDVKLRSLAFVAVGKISRSSSNKLTKDIQALQIFFGYMCQDEPQVLVVTIQHGVTVFSCDHIPSRSILKLGAGDLISGNPSIAKEKCVTTIATLLTDENLSKTSFACLALGENGRKGPLPLLPGSEQFPDTEVKHEVDFKDQDITKTWLVRNLVAMFKTSNGSSKIVSSVLKTFIFLTLLCATNGLQTFEVENCIHYPGGAFSCKIKQQETTQTTTQTHYNKIIFFLVVIAVAVISGYCLWKRTVQFRREIGARFVNGRGIRHLGIADIGKRIAATIRSQRINIICVGIGEQVNLLGELSEIAGSDKNVFISRTFDTLPYLDDEILARVYTLCLEGKNAN